MADADINRKTDELLKQLKFSEHKNDIVAGIPLGWKQKLAFSVSIFHEPEVVFLDEPTGGVDPATRGQFWELIYAAAARGIMFSSPPITWTRLNIATASPSWSTAR